MKKLALKHFGLRELDILAAKVLLSKTIQGALFVKNILKRHSFVKQKKLDQNFRILRLLVEYLKVDYSEEKKLQVKMDEKETRFTRSDLDRKETQFTLDEKLPIYPDSEEEITLREIIANMKDFIEEMKKVIEHELGVL